jgi:hypothetical protein
VFGGCRLGVGPSDDGYANGRTAATAGAAGVTT